MRPFLKWAGNKYRVLKHITPLLARMPSARLIEPFLGSGAVFLNSEFEHYLLSDANPDLIALYQYLQHFGNDYIEYCKGFFNNKNNTEPNYYKLREKFNSTQDISLKSALFLFLNKHGFNGLCRYNNQGGYNVPYGFYKKPYFPEKEMAHFVKQSKLAHFQTSDFASVMQEAGNGDVVYCDPPYVPLSKTANFSQYAQTAFSAADQARLVKEAKRAAARGAKVIISNHNTEESQLLYQGASLTEIHVNRHISCKGETRGKARELLAIYE